MAAPRTSGCTQYASGRGATARVRHAGVVFRAMSDNQPSSPKTWRYHFTRKGGDEIEAGEFTGDEEAIDRGRELSTSMVEPVIVERYGVVSWHYVDEVDERP